MNINKDIEHKLKQEIAHFNNQKKVHSLPKSYNYWSKTYLRPKLEELGFSGLQNFYVKAIGDVVSNNSSKAIIILSVGSGNCDTEVGLAKSLIKEGISNFVIRCLDINEAMITRGKLLVEQNDLSKQFQFEIQDFNYLSLDPRSVDVIFANHSLHHVQALEHLFNTLHIALKDQGIFLLNDMIGRNGHMKWPEALITIESIWDMLSDEKKFHHQLQVIHHTYPNIDCSQIGFEGIRAQDILPLLLEFFSADTFLGFMNIVQPFISRGYGPNFDPDIDADKLFLDYVANLDDTLIDKGIVKPTQAIAVFTKFKYGRQRYYRRRSAEFSVRWS